VIKSYLATQLCSPEAEISCGHSGIWGIGKNIIEWGLRNAVTEAKC
jgi:hypothetical protein